MVNPKGELPIVIEGATYRLTLKTLGLIHLQKHFNAGDQIADIDDIFKKMAAGSLEHIVVMFWCAFLHHHPEMTLEKATALIDQAGGVLGIGQQLAALGQSVTPDPDDVKELEDGETPRKAQPIRGRGARSTFRAAASA